jgi:hypothetical protein
MVCFGQGPLSVGDPFLESFNSGWFLVSANLRRPSEDLRLGLDKKKKKIKKRRDHLEQKQYIRSYTMNNVLLITSENERI